MNKKLNEQADALKKSIDSTSRKSKETVKALINANIKLLDSSIDASKKSFDSMSKLLSEKGMDTSIISTFKSVFTKSIKLSEDTIDSVIDSHNRRVDLSIDFVTKFTEAIKNEGTSSRKGIETLIGLVKENLDKSTELSKSSTEKFAVVYKDHLELLLNFRKKFATNMSSKLESMFKLQGENIDAIFSLDIIEEWWEKTADVEKVDA